MHTGGRTICRIHVAWKSINVYDEFYTYTQIHKHIYIIYIYTIYIIYKHNNNTNYCELILNF